MTILACYNIKGGVGKTATAVNLAMLAAREGRRTLLWDLDPQGAATFYLGAEAGLRGSAKKLARGRRPLAAEVRGCRHPLLELVPADVGYRHLDLHLERGQDPRGQLGRLLAPLESVYEVVILDAPPSLSRLSESIFAAATALLVPTIPTTLSLRTLDQLIGVVRAAGGTTSLLPFFSMVDRRKTLHRMILERPPRLGAEWLPTHVPYASEIERMGVARSTVIEAAPGGRAARVYGALWADVRQRLGWP